MRRADFELAFRILTGEEKMEKREINEVVRQVKITRVVVYGRLGDDPEIREINGKSLCKLSVAISGPKNETTWRNMVIWNENAKRAYKTFKKGQEIFARGYLKSKKWVDSRGVTRQDHEFNAVEIGISL